MAAASAKLPPVKVVNTEDEETAPINFEWTEECTPNDDTVDGHEGCRCAAGACAAGACPCAPASLQPAGDGRWVVLPALRSDQDELSACGPACACRGGCGCGGGWGGGGGVPPLPVTLCKLPGKGWAVVADEGLPQGLLVSYYAGKFKRVFASLAVAFEIATCAFRTACLNASCARGRRQPPTSSHPCACRRIRQQFGGAEAAGGL